LLRKGFDLKDSSGVKFKARKRADEGQENVCPPLLMSCTLPSALFKARKSHHQRENSISDALSLCVAIILPGTMQKSLLNGLKRLLNWKSSGELNFLLARARKKPKHRKHPFPVPLK
jgi:hypothetical protein